MMAPEMRIGDRERERAAAALGEHFALGRLDNDEYTERLDAIWSSRTRRDLDQLFWDLPTQAASRPTPPPTRYRRRRHRIPVLPVLLALAVLLVLMHIPLWLPVVVIAVLWFRRSGTAGKRR